MASANQWRPSYCGSIAATTTPNLRIAIVALSLGGFTIGVAEFLTMGLLPRIARSVDVSVPTAGRAVSAYALGVVVGAPLLAAGGARFPRKAMLVWLMVALGAGNLLSALAPGFGTLVASRFVAGLPHGAYFGIASLVAAELAGPGRRAQAVASVLLGLSVANVFGVPAVTWLGQAFGWRAAYAAVAVLAAFTVAGVIAAVPATTHDRSATIRRELGALRRGRVWLTLAAGAIGGAGFFSVYSYIVPILTDRTGVSTTLVPIGLAVWGLGMVAGNLVSGRLVDRRPRTSGYIFLGWMVLVFALFAVTSAHPLTALPTMFLLGGSLSLPTAIQVRLMDVAGDAQTLAAALNHSAFNAANALGAWLGGLVLSAGLGLTAPMWLAVALTVAGTGVFALSIARSPNRHVRAPA